MKIRVNLSNTVLLGILILGLNVGCVQFIGDEGPNYTNEEIWAKARGENLAIDYMAKVLLNGESYTDGWFSDMYLAQTMAFEQTVLQIFSEMGNFSQISKGIGSQPYHVNLILDKDSTGGTLAFTTLLACLTLSIIPAHVEHHYDLKAEVYYDGELIRNYEYKEYSSIWGGIFVFPFMFSSDNHGGFNHLEPMIVRSLLINFLYDFQKDHSIR